MKNIVIYGPTAVGKSDIAVELAKKINAEIISCDSMQIYTDLNIGSAKITKQEMQGIAHHMLNIKSSNSSYSVFEYVSDCKKCIQDIKSRNKNVIIVGGTGLYIKALTEDYNYGNAKLDTTLRQKLEQYSTQELIEILNQKGEQVKQDDINNKPRLIRKLEILEYGKQKTKKENKDFLIFGLYSDRQLLYDRINKRVDKMMSQGLLEETKQIYSKYGEQNQCFKAIGYKELLPYIKGEDTLEHCIELIKQHSRNYAKRQITFFNQFASIKKIEVTSINQAYQQILSQIEEQND